MNHALMNKIASAVLYEGYILYPYRPSVKNQHRWTFGGLFPQAYSEAHSTGDAWFLQAECIVLGTESTKLEVKVRFLHLVDRRVGRLRDGQIEMVDSLSVGDKKYQPWQEAIEREVVIPTVSLGDLLAASMHQHFEFPLTDAREKINDGSGQTVGFLIRRQQAIEGSVEISTEQLEKGVFRISIRACNRTPIAAVGQETEGRSDLTPSLPYSGERAGVRGPLSSGATCSTAPHPNPLPRVQGRRDQKDRRLPDQGPFGNPPRCNREAALLQSFCSTHVGLGVFDGEFISLTDPPAQLQEAVASCKNIGVWPVLIGEPGATDALLASPIILSDYPRIAPESPGDLFDGGEIDEILTLRIMTLTDEEKRDVSAIDSRADAMLKRTESLAREQLMNLHGGMRNADPFPPGDIFPAWDVTSDKQVMPSIRAGGVELHPGDRVRLRPRGGADAFDILLNGKTATIAKIEQDFEDRIHLAVTVDDDPGADFGVAGKPGHRFFFRLDEVEPIS